MGETRDGSPVGSGAAPGVTPPDGTASHNGRPPTSLTRLADGLRRTDRSPGLVKAVRALRRVVPGGELADDRPGGPRTTDRIARLIAEVAADQPSATRELGLTAIQVWQAASGSRALRRPGGEISIAFTDLVEFSEWALRAGDEQVLRLLGEVERASEAVVARHGGKVVKSLGDGLMAVFPQPDAAITACHEMCRAVSAIDLDGYRPRLRAGVHTGRPRKVGRDYLGVDVNVAARVADAASAGEVLVSGPALEAAQADRYTVRRRRFRAKGAPRDLTVYSVVPKERPDAG